MEHENKMTESQQKVKESRSSDVRLREGNSPRGTGAQKRSQKQKRGHKKGQTCVKDRPSAVVSPYLTAFSSSRHPAEVQNGVPLHLDENTSCRLSAYQQQITDLKNKLVDLQRQRKCAQKENLLLKHRQLYRERLLDQFKVRDNDMSEIISDYKTQIKIQQEKLESVQKKEHQAVISGKVARQQLQNYHDQLQGLEELTDQRLRNRDELARELQQTQVTLQKCKHRVKEMKTDVLSRTELSQRLLANEQKKNHVVQQEIQKLREKFDQKPEDLKKELELNKGQFQRLLVNRQKKIDAVQQESDRLQREFSSLTAPKMKERIPELRKIYGSPAVPEVSKKKKAVVDSTRGRGAKERDSGAVQTKDSNLHLDTPSTIPEVVNDGEFFSNEKAKEQEEGAQMVEMKEQESKIPADQVRSEESPAQELAKEKRKSSNIIKKLFGFWVHK